MVLPIPTVTLGPLYAYENNQAFIVIDNHDHSPGKGLPVPSNGVNINGDFPFNGFNAAFLRSTRFSDQVAPLSLPLDVTSLYTVGGNLYYNNGIGQQIQLTAGAALNATSIGGIGGDYATSTASEFYTSSDSTFTFWSAVNTSAALDSGSITIRPDNVPNAFGITISAPISLSADYGLTLPNALPGSGTKFLTVDSSGNIADVYDVDNSTLQVVSNTIQVVPQGITATQIANNTITQQQLAANVGVAPSGAITMYGGASAPSNWLLCDGTSYLRATYPALFTAIGTAFGAADGTHFNVPDLRGLFARGVDGGAGNDPETSSRTAANPGGNTGDNVGSLQMDEVGPHTHTINTYDLPRGIVTTAVAEGNLIGIGTATTNASTGAETRPKNVYVNYIIKT